MVITDVEAMVLKAPVPGIEQWQAASFARPFKWAETTLVRITTDDGLTGYGEVHAPVAPEVTKSVIDTLLSPLLIGRNPLDVAVLWDDMYALMRPRGHALGFMVEAMSGVDIALYDICGKALNVPVYTLLGGKRRDRIRTYASILHWIAPNELAKLAGCFVDKGFTAMKIKVGQDYHIDRAKIRQVRSEVGEEIDLMADANCRYTVAEAMPILRALEEHNFVWLEEPVPPEDISGYCELRSRTHLAIAGGECECTHYRFAELFDRRAFDVAQPDICRAGGVTACHRIGIFADAHNIRIAPHVSIGSAIHIAASLHWAVSAKTAWIHEYPVFSNPLVDDLLNDSYQWCDGYLIVNDAPGLGLTVRADVIDKYRTA